MKKWIFPVIASVVLVAAIGIIHFVPATEEKADSSYAPRNADGDIVIQAEKLTQDTVSFIHVAEDSKIELMARIGDDGQVKLAFGTCQSCNGSPYAYYTQEDDQLVCNNCGLSFPISVLDEPGGGCHPIIVPDTIIRKTDDGIVLDAKAIMQYEGLFEKVAAH